MERTRSPHPTTGSGEPLALSTRGSREECSSPHQASGSRTAQAQLFRTPSPSRRERAERPPRRGSYTVGGAQALRAGTPQRAGSAGDAHVSPRVSPYPQRVRTPRRLTQESPARSNDQAVSSSPAAGAHHHRLQLIVRPIIKTTVGQRNTSGETLDDFAVNGATFKDIMNKLWLQFSSRVKAQAVKQDGTWSVTTPAETSWSKVMQFKGDRHLVDSSKTEQAWNRWVISTRGETVRLMIYEYGMAITKAQDLEDFLAACIRPAATDRSGAAAESEVRDVVAKLQDIWQETFQADAVVWRMWANHIMRGLNRSTWERDILDPPPEYVALLLKPADSPAERQLLGLSRSSNLAAEVIQACIADNRQMKRSCVMLGEQLDVQFRQLETRMRTIDAILADVRPPALEDVIDPLPRMENLDDIEHQE